jgi:putative transposase
LWFNSGSYIRLRPEYRNQVWSYDFLTERMSDEKAIRILNIINECTKECLATKVGRKITSSDVIDKLADLFIEGGGPKFIRSDNGPEFVAELLRRWLKDLGIQTAYIEPGSSWENGYIESFNGKFRDELLNSEVFDTITEAQVITEQWRMYYNAIRPHSSLKYYPPASGTFIPYQVANA